MVVVEGGQRYGSISAGCVEAEIAMHAEAVLESGGPLLVTISTGSEQEIYFGTGTGCDGEMQILLEIAADKGALVAPYDVIAPAIMSRAPIVLATRVDSGPNTPPRVTQAWRIGASPAAGWGGDATVRAALCRLLDETQTSGAHLDASCIAGVTGIASDETVCLIERIEPALRLVVCGAGPVAEALSSIAAQLGWRVTGVDRRATFATEAFFPGAETVVCGAYTDIAALIPTDARTAAVLLSHNLLDDAALLRGFLDTPVAAVSIVSSVTRAQRIFAQLAEDGRPVTAADREGIFAPAGLDIGAETPEEIALAIVAELQAHITGRAGAPLRIVRSKPQAVAT
jgi:xanthine/CO dehydrogenase XdhC/CoxF family maturation factor